MSVSVKKNSITMTRGDTLRVKVDIYRTVDGEQEPYTPTVSDSLRFALKHPTMNATRTEYTDQNPLITKTIPTDTMVLTLLPTDTKPLGFGEYVYDIELTMEDGTVDTFISEAKFTLSPEVH